MSLCVLDFEAGTSHLAQMFPLSAPTRSDWIQEVLDDLPALLIDHAHCEKKAASTAIGLIFRYPEHLKIMAPLSMLAREELLHFERVLSLLKSRNIQFGRQLPAVYAGALVKGIRREEPGKMLDTLLCCALIEARSHERMEILVKAFEESEDSELAKLYKSLLASEERHKNDYLQMAQDLFSQDEFDTRLQFLAEREAEILDKSNTAPRMHS